MPCLAWLNRTLLALWAGALLWMGAVVAPTLFASLPSRALAGQTAGVLFAYLDWLGVACALWLFSCEARQRRLTASLAWLAVIAVLLLHRLWWAPEMARLKVAGLYLSDNASRFGIMHGVSSATYWLVTLFVLWSVWRLGRASWRP